MSGVKITPFASLILGSTLLLGSTVSGQTLKWAPMPVPPGTTVPVNSHQDSQGNTYAISSSYSIAKTTPAGVTTVVAAAHQLAQDYRPAPGFYFPASTYDYIFSDLVVDGADNIYAAEVPYGIAGMTSEPELILKITPGGLVTTITVNAGPLVFGKAPNRSALTVDVVGNLYTVGVDGSIYEIEPDGTQLLVAPDSWFYDNIGNFPYPPQGLTVDADGVLYTNVGRLNLQPYVGPLEIRPLGAAPIVTFQPKGGSIAFGSSLALTVIAAVGDGSPTCQWFRDGLLVPGGSSAMQDLGTSSFFSGCLATLPGVYTAVISAGGWSVTSSPVVVAVVGPGGIPITATPLITTQPADGVFDYGGSVQLSVSTMATLPVSYQWRLDGKDLPQATASTYTATQAGTYTVLVSTAAGSVASRDAAIALANRPVNLSSRAEIGTQDDIAIAGFVVSAPADRTKTVLIRAVGPGLTAFGLGTAEVLAQPVLSIFDAQGRVIATNRGWADSPAVAAAGKATGAFDLQPGSADAALVLDLAGGGYTAQVSGANGTTGVALVEAYELAADSTHFVNISTRARVGTGADILIGGFVTGGVRDSRMLIRAIGPGLASKGVSGTLAQPVLSLYDASGRLIAINVGWSNGASADALAIASTANRIGAFALAPGSTDCALLLTLPSGAYTVEVTGVNGSTGVALFEAYQVPD